MTFMRQRDSGVIRRPPDEVWPWIADPARVARWNDKLRSSGAPTLDGLRVGSSWAARYQLGRRPVEVQAVVEACVPGRELKTRYRWGPESWAVESSTLEVVSEGTRLTRTVEIRDPRIPWPARLLSGLLMRFGKPRSAMTDRNEAGDETGDSMVARIRRLVEDGD